MRQLMCLMLFIGIVVGSEIEEPSKSTQKVCGTAIPHELTRDDDILILYPWIVILEYTSAVGRKLLFCGGTLIDEQHVLTAAHCIKNTQFPKLTSVRLGSWNLDTLENCHPNKGIAQCADPVERITINQTFIHENYSAADKNNHHDIALIQLSEPVQFTEYIQPICLPKEKKMEISEDTSDLEADNEFTIAEWSRIPSKLKDDKLITHVKKLSLDVCNEKLEKMRRTVMDTQICTSGSCGLDGLPLMSVYTDETGNNITYITGVSSYGSTPCRSQVDVYTLVVSYIDWIKSKIEYDED